MLDATSEITDQDQKIAGKIEEAGKAAVIVLNKWDLVPDKSSRLMNDITGSVLTALRSLSFAEVIFTSSLTRQRVSRILDAALAADKETRKRINTGLINQIINESVALTPPPSSKRGKRLKVYYTTQVSTAPPTFVLFTNDAELMTPSYHTYLERKIREAFGYHGSPIRLATEIQERQQIVRGEKQLLSALILIAVSYLFGSIPTGFWTVRIIKGVDIRRVGSGSTGATNVWRCAGKGPGVFVFLVDVAKGYVPVMVAVYMESAAAQPEWSGAYCHVIPVAVAAAALVGHSKSVFLNFQGGKSAATGLGTVCALNPQGALLAFGTWIAVLAVTRFVSLASILAVASSVFYFYFLHSPPAYVVYCIISFCYVTYRHKENIRRLLSGTEPRVSDKPKSVANAGPVVNASLHKSNTSIDVDVAQPK